MSKHHRKNNPERREARKNRAIERQETQSKRSIKEQIEKLDLKFGKDQGAQKERTKLKKRAENALSAQAKVKKDIEEVADKEILKDVS